MTRGLSFFLLTHWLLRRQPPIQHSIAPFLMQPGSNVTIAAHLFHQTWDLQPSTPPPLPPTAGTTALLDPHSSAALPVHPLFNRGFNIRFPSREKANFTLLCYLSSRTNENHQSSVRSFPLGRAAKARTSSCASCSRESVGCLPAHLEDL